MINLSALGTSLYQFFEENDMKFTPPTKLVFWITVVLTALGLIGSIVTIPFVSAYAFWFVLVAYVVLAVSLMVKGM
jgi:hypothetical protein